ncbi:hypothetical protein ACF046_06230 [Glutamicibacter creatinolyticus]|uniref:hypothetical protein n=1 Tax=Glutamicibacter TaxID=1742989 RepID=UPI0032166FA3
MQNTSNNQDKANEQDAKLKDHVSDPKLSDDIGQDWTDEGGATHQGAATATPAHADES